MSRGRFAYEATCGDGSDTTVGDVPRHPSPTAERLTAGVRELAKATLGEDTTAANDVLARIAHRVAEVEPRTSVPLATTVAVYRRDSWTWILRRTDYPDPCTANSQPFTRTTSRITPTGRPASITRRTCS